MSDEFKPKTLTHLDGREVEVTTPAEEVAANFDGFAERTPAEKASATKARKAAGSDSGKRRVARTGTKPTDEKAGGPAPADEPVAPAV